MSHWTLRLAPPNSLILVLDPRTGALPEAMSGQAIASTDSAIAIGTLAEVDGETEIHFSSPAEVPTDGDLQVEWSGVLATSGCLGLITINNDVLLEVPATDSVSVQIWTNDPSEPSLIWVTAESR